MLFIQTRDPVVVKNTPETNEMLWHVKHLIKVRPITFPHGVPTEEDIGYATLMPSGELVIRKQLKVDLKELEPHPQDPKAMDSKMIGEHLRLKWMIGYD